MKALEKERESMATEIDKLSKDVENSKEELRLTREGLACAEQERKDIVNSSENKL